MTELERTYSCFKIRGSSGLHQSLDALKPIVEQEIAITLDELTRTGWQEQEEILVYLHYSYFYRYSLPALEAVVGLNRVIEKPELVRMMMHCCLVGRFIDDLIDRDSGFWTTQQALYWFSYFLVRCENQRASLHLSQNDDVSWRTYIFRAINESRRLFINHGGMASMQVPEINSMPLERYPERIPYYFWLLEILNPAESRMEWVRKYVSTLFFSYDIDDAVSDIIHNIPTEPAFELLRASLDNEGHFKVRHMDSQHVIRQLEQKCYLTLKECEEQGRRLGLELGVSILNDELQRYQQNGK